MVVCNLLQMRIRVSLVLAGVSGTRKLCMISMRNLHLPIDERYGGAREAIRTSIVEVKPHILSGPESHFLCRWDTRR